ncbi:MAG: hypothetical protein IJ583_03365 [Firmicutes bacterium]|nr:hypothetical protein [Bacillota bacterium]
MGNRTQNKNITVDNLNFKKIIVKFTKKFLKKYFHFENVCDIITIQGNSTYFFGAFYRIFAPKRKILYIIFDEILLY